MDETSGCAWRWLGNVDKFVLCFEYNNTRARSPQNRISSSRNSRSIWSENCIEIDTESHSSHLFSAWYNYCKRFEQHWSVQGEWYYCGEISFFIYIKSYWIYFQLHSPPYASSLLIELYRQKNEFYFQIFYRWSNTDNPRPLYIPLFGVKCSIEQFRQAYKEIIPTGSYEEECRLWYLFWKFSSYVAKLFVFVSFRNDEAFSNLKIVQNKATNNKINSIVEQRCWSWECFDETELPFELMFLLFNRCANNCLRCAHYRTPCLLSKLNKFGRSFCE